MNQQEWNYRSFDWNRVWRTHHAQKAMNGRTGDNHWDKRAKDFTRAVTKGDYVEQFLSMCDVRPGESVLDVGAAAGTLAVPLSAKAAAVTALEPSPVMRMLLEERCKKDGILNVNAVEGRWEDNWEALGIGVHDVAIASRSLIVNDLSMAIEKLQSHARRRVYLATLVDDGPFDRNLIMAVGRDFNPGIDYIVVMNYLRQIGVYANLAFTVHREDCAFASLDDAVEGLAWMVHEMTEDERVRLRDHLSRTLVPHGDLLALPRAHTVRWAVMWWDRDNS